MKAAHSPKPLDLYPNFESYLAHSRGVKRVLMKALPFIPRHAYHPVLNELRLALNRLLGHLNPAHRRYKGQRNLMVNIGCGSFGMPGWVNIDVYHLPGVNCVFDCRKNLPFDDGSVKGIFTEHFFEHIDYCEEVPFFLSECYRTLQPGGVLRIVVPDAEKYLRAYCSEGWEELTKIRPLGPDHSDQAAYGTKYNTKMELLNVVFRQYREHKFAYDFVTLEFVLRRYGFSQVRHSEFGVSLLPELSIDLPERASESLYVEAVK